MRSRARAGLAEYRHHQRRFAGAAGLDQVTIFVDPRSMPERDDVAAQALTPRTLRSVVMGLRSSWRFSFRRNCL
jgi:hypothetical protein